MKSSGLESGRFHHHAVGHHLGARRIAKATGAKERARGQADEAVAAKTLAPHHRLQQKTEGRAVGQFEVERERRFQVGKGLRHNRYAVEALGV